MSTESATTTDAPKKKRVTAYAFTIKGRIILEKTNNSKQTIAAQNAIEAVEKQLTDAGAKFATTTQIGQVEVPADAEDTTGEKQPG